MELEAITTVLRPRRHWEAMDLGFALARRWWRPLYRAWFLLLLPLTLLLHLLCYRHLWLVPLLLWWLKPLLDRVPLYILSHTLFGEVPGIRQTLKALPRLLSRQALWALTFARLDPARSFHLPVWQLEQLRGSARRRRQRVLDTQQKGAVWLTFTCAHFELIADLGLVALVWLLLPDFVRLDFWELLEDKTVLQQLWLNLVEIFGLSLIEPFYVAAGFTLYLNRRTWLEAWDIEIGFRRLARRLAVSSTTPVLLVAVLCLGLPGEVQAQLQRIPEFLPASPVGASLLAKGTGSGLSNSRASSLLPDTPSKETTAQPATSPACQDWAVRQTRLEQSDSTIKRTLAQVLQADEFPHCEPTSAWHFEWNEQPSEEHRASRLESSLGVWLARVVEMLAWITLLGFIVALIWRLAKRLPRAGAAPTATTAMPPEAIASLPEPLAPTAAMAAWRLWQAGQPREALGLLYRSSLVGLRARYRLPFSPGTTEDECLRLIGITLTDRPELVQFLTRLTRHWQATAYAHRLPDSITMQELCEQWPHHFPA
ncbi:MAG: DUF4129 domain-containing protein [Candidatus Competibacteraceae bacterium]